MSKVGTIGRPSGRRGRRQAVLAAALIVVAGLGQPLFASMVAEYYEPAAMVLPLIVLVAAICVICPCRGVPLLAACGITAVEAAWMFFRAGAAPPVLMDEVFSGHPHRLWVVPAAAAAGYAVVRLRRRYGVFPPGFRTNLRILTRRPLLFVRKYRLPLAILVLGAALDAITTMDFMLQYGPGEELHPAARIAAEVFGVRAGVILGSFVRLGFVVAVAAVWRKWCGWMMAVCGVLYALAAASNHFGWMRWFWLWWW